MARVDTLLDEHVRPADTEPPSGVQAQEQGADVGEEQQKPTPALALTPATQVAMPAPAMNYRGNNPYRAQRLSP
jgi:hypothetical protein